LAIVGLVLVGIGAATARGQGEYAGHGPNDGIAVSGIGTAMAMPDVARVEIRMQGKAEITDDALVKYHATQKRLTEALEKLKIENLKISERDLSLSSAGAGNNSQMMMMGMGNQGGDTATSTEITGILRAELTNLQGMPKDEIWKVIGKLLDAIRDAGGSVGPSSAEMNMAWRYGRMPSNQSVKFVLSDLKPLREQAYERAVADARTRGDRLARLSGIKLGRVSSVQEIHVAGDQADMNRGPYYFWMDQSEAPSEKDEIAVDRLKEIPVMVRLSVRFEIAGPAESPAEGSAKAQVIDSKVTTQ
jgi:uncharacterized protein YggE